MDVIEKARSSGVTMLGFPAHYTHLLQPLNVGFFQPMKHHHQNILAEQVRWGGTKYSKQDFLDAYREICARTAKKHTIQHA